MTSDDVAVECVSVAWVIFLIGVSYVTVSSSPPWTNSQASLARLVGEFPADPLSDLLFYPWSQQIQQGLYFPAIPG